MKEKSQNLKLDKLLNHNTLDMNSYFYSVLTEAFDQKIKVSVYTGSSDVPFVGKVYRLSPKSSIYTGQDFLVCLVDGRTHSLLQVSSITGITFDI